MIANGLEQSRILDQRYYWRNQYDDEAQEIVDPLVFTAYY